LARPYRSARADSDALAAPGAGGGPQRRSRSRSRDALPSPHTVRTHINNVRRKLGARNAAQAAGLACANSLMVPALPASPRRGSQPSRHGRDATAGCSRTTAG